MIRRIVGCLILLLIWLPEQSPHAQTPLDSAFTYQGQLVQGGTGVTGECDFSFGLWDAVTGGTEVATAVDALDVSVDGGVFSTELDFGPATFDGTAHWLEIAVVCPAGSGAYTTLAPRQELTATPNASYASEAGGMDWSGLRNVPADLADGDDVDDADSNSTNELQDLTLNGNVLSLTGDASSVDLSGYLDDTDTTYSAGTGLNLNAEEFSVDSSIVQNRVDGICETGTYLVGIDQDGKPQCMVLPAGFDFTLDNNGDVGTSTSMAVRNNGLPIISYFDSTNLDLKVFDCSNAACSAGTTRTLDATGEVGYNTSIVVRPDGLPIISYYDASNEDLKVYDCTSTDCSTGSARTLDSAGSVGNHSSIALRPGAPPIISYLDSTNEDLKVYDCIDPNCTVGFARTLDTAGSVGFFTSVAIRDNGLPIISYLDNTNNNLKVFDCTNEACTGGSAYTLDSSGTVGVHSKVAIRSNGLPIISYFDGGNFDLKVFDCTNTLCSEGTAYPVDSQGQVGTYVSLVIRENGLPMISYQDRDGFDLKVFDCADTACQAGTSRTLDSVGNVGYFTAMAIRASGLPIIAHYDNSNGALKVYSCGDVNCELDAEPNTAGSGLVLSGTQLSVDTEAIQARVTGSCPAGEFIRSIDAAGNVVCEVDADTSYTPGSGLLLDAGEFSIDSTVVQARVSGTCPAGQSIRSIDAAGNVICEVDTDTDTAYTAGSGLVLDADEFSVDSTAVQTRVSGICPEGEAIRSIDAEGNVTCMVSLLQRVAYLEARLAQFDYDYDGYSITDGDCDDTNPEINPDAFDGPDGIDEDCNGVIDDGEGKFIFVSSSFMKGRFGGLAAADAICQDLADGSTIVTPGTYKAWLSAEIDARDRLAHSALSYINTQYERLAYNWDGLTQPSNGVLKPVRYDQNGSEPDEFEYAWTGTDEEGFLDNVTQICEFWAVNPSGAAQGLVGRSDLSGPDWTRVELKYCWDDWARLYCVEQ